VISARAVAAKHCQSWCRGWSHDPRCMAFVQGEKVKGQGQVTYQQQTL